MHKIRELYNRPAAQGFTLIEMAIVLVVIGLMRGRVFKGRQLIASAKVKNANAGYNKVIAGMNTFYDRYGLYPGDGCESDVDLGDPTSCDDGTQNGLISGDNEEQAFWSFMTNATTILSASARESALGSTEWDVAGNTNSSWIYTEGADLRLVCDLDRVADDGVPDDGDIQAGNSDVTDNWGGNNAEYGGTASPDCWSLTGTTDVQLQILP